MYIGISSIQNHPIAALVVDGPYLGEVVKSDGTLSVLLVLSSGSGESLPSCTRCILLLLNVVVVVEQLFLPLPRS